MYKKTKFRKDYLKYTQVTNQKVEVILGILNKDTVDEKIILPFNVFNNEIVETHKFKDNRLSVFKKSQLFKKAVHIISSNLYSKKDLESLTSLENIIKSKYNGHEVFWDSHVLTVDLYEFIAPENEVIRLTQRYLKAYDEHARAKSYNKCSKDSNPNIVAGLREFREEFPYICETKVRTRQKLLDACGNDKDYFNYSLYYVRNLLNAKR